MKQACVLLYVETESDSSVYLKRGYREMPNNLSYLVLYYNNKMLESWCFIKKICFGS